MKIYACGEALIDFIPNASSPTQYTKFAGGAPANVAVALARLNCDSAFIGNVGDDAFGHFLHKVISDNGVDTSPMQLLADHQTALAIVSLDETGDRAFKFYSDHAAHTTLNMQDAQRLKLDIPTILHIGSNTFSHRQALNFCKQLIDLFRSTGALISLDVNYRPTFWTDDLNPADTIAEIAQQCDIIKASRDELKDLYPSQPQDQWPQMCIDAGVGLVTVTDGALPIHYWSQADQGTVSPPQINAVDTTAAGDAFVGGLLCQIASHNQSKAEFNHWLAQPSTASNAIVFASQCSAIAASRSGAIDSLPFAAEIIGSAPH